MIHGKSAYVHAGPLAVCFSCYLGLLLWLHVTPSLCQRGYVVLFFHDTMDKCLQRYLIARYECISVRTVACQYNCNCWRQLLRGEDMCHHQGARGKSLSLLASSFLKDLIGLTAFRTFRNRAHKVNYHLYNASKSARFLGLVIGCIGSAIPSISTILIAMLCESNQIDQLNFVGTVEQSIFAISLVKHRKGHTINKLQTHLGSWCSCSIYFIKALQETLIGVPRVPSFWLVSDGSDLSIYAIAILQNRRG